MFQLFPVIGLLFANPPLLVAQQSSGSGFNIYCTSNLDGTGACNRVDNNQPIDCLVIPGGVIDCKEVGDKPIQCVLYASVLDSQAYFYCTRRTDPGLRDNRIKSDRFDQSSSSVTDQQQSIDKPALADLLPPLEQPLDSVLKSPNNDFF